MVAIVAHDTAENEPLKVLEENSIHYSFASLGAGRGGVRAGLRDANAAPRVERRRAETLAPLRKIEMYLRLFHLLPHFFMFRHSSRHSKTLFS